MKAKLPSKTTRQKKYDPEGLRARVLDEAIHLFAEEGFFQTSFQSIARRLKVSQSALMNHYPSKITLIRAVVDEVVRRGQLFTISADSPEFDALRKLASHFDRTAEWAIRHPSEAQVLLLLYYMGAWSEDFRALYEKILSGARLRILTIVHAGVREKKFKLNADPEEVAALLHDALLGSILNEIASGRPKRASKAFAKKRDALFHGLLGTKLI